MSLTIAIVTATTLNQRHRSLNLGLWVGQIKSVLIKRGRYHTVASKGAPAIISVLQLTVRQLIQPHMRIIMRTLLLELHSFVVGFGFYFKALKDWLHFSDPEV